MEIPEITPVPENTTDPAAGLNIALNALRALLQTEVLSINLTAPPSDPDDNDMYIVAGLGGIASGAWSGQEYNLARYIADGSYWEFHQAGSDIKMVVNRANNTVAIFDSEGSPPEWTEVAGESSFGGLTPRNDVSSAGIDSGEVNVDYNLGDYFELLLDEAVTDWAFDNLPAPGKGGTILIKITQGGTPVTVDWPASFLWANGVAPSVSSVADAVDILALTTFDSGTTWYATLSKAHA